MWSSRSAELRPGVLHFAVDRDGSEVAYSEVLRLWQQDAGFRAFFTSLLAGVPFAEFRWETPPITSDTVGRPFEFVVLDAPGLARRADPDAFAEHFGDRGQAVVSFANLGKDAILVVPCPAGEAGAYGHLAAFVRGAPDEQKHALWEEVGKAAARRFGRAPVWISTAGAGVSWLHVRLDDRPKYYGHGPYRHTG